MEVVAVPNWSFGRDRRLLQSFSDALNARAVKLHYLQSDVDHNRTVSAFSGDQEAVAEAVLALAGLAFDRIDLNRHTGVHPRIGALDVCPFLPYPVPGFEAEPFRAWVESVAQALAEEFSLPVFLYEKSERGRHEADLPSLRKGGFGGLLERVIEPDYGPARAHPTLGVTVMGWREFLIACNLNLSTPDRHYPQKLAREVRELRTQGAEGFLGVRALGWYLPTANVGQLSLNLTLPDLTSPDRIWEWAYDRCQEEGHPIRGAELIGVLRDKDQAGCSRFPYRPEQVVNLP